MKIHTGGGVKAPATQASAEPETPKATTGRGIAAARDGFEVARTSSKEEPGPHSKQIDPSKFKGAVKGATAEVISVFTFGASSSGGGVEGGAGAAAAAAIAAAAAAASQGLAVDDTEGKTHTRPTKKHGRD